jgi:hypothetical protein
LDDAATLLSVAFSLPWLQQPKPVIGIPLSRLPHRHGAVQPIPDRTNRAVPARSPRKEPDQQKNRAADFIAESVIV